MHLFIVHSLFLFFSLIKQFCLFVNDHSRLRRKFTLHNHVNVYTNTSPAQIHRHQHSRAVRLVGLPWFPKAGPKVRVGGGRRGAEVDVPQPASERTAEVRAGNNCGRRTQGTLGSESAGAGQRRQPGGRLLLRHGRRADREEDTALPQRALARCHQLPRHRQDDGGPTRGEVSIVTRCLG